MPANANLNQNAQGVWSSNNVVVPKGEGTVTFRNHSANSCTVTFSNPPTFGFPQYTFPGSTDTPLPILLPESTVFTLPDTGAPAGQQYTITVDTDQAARAQYGS